MLSFWASLVEICRRSQRIALEVSIWEQSSPHAPFSFFFPVNAQNKQEKKEKYIKNPHL